MMHNEFKGSKNEHQKRPFSLFLSFSVNECRTRFACRWDDPVFLQHVDIVLRRNAFWVHYWGEKTRMKNRWLYYDWCRHRIAAAMWMNEWTNMYVQCTRRYTHMKEVCEAKGASHRFSTFPTVEKKIVSFEFSDDKFFFCSEKSFRGKNDASVAYLVEFFMDGVRNALGGQQVKWVSFRRLLCKIGLNITFTRTAPTEKRILHMKYTFLHYFTSEKTSLFSEEKKKWPYTVDIG